MRCQELQDDLILAWEGCPTSSKVAEHLARCPACAARFSGTRQLARTWEATQPAVPSATDWESVWSRIEESMEAPAKLTAEELVLTHSPGGRWTPFASFGVGLSLAAMLLLAFVLPIWNDQPDQARFTQGDPGPASRPLTDIPDHSVSARSLLEILPGQISLYRVDEGVLNVVVGESEDFDDFLAFHGHFETLDRGKPIRWFVDVDPGQTVLYSIDDDVVTVVDEPGVMAWIPDVDDEFLAFFAEAECEFRFGVLALNGDPILNPFAR